MQITYEIEACVSFWSSLPRLYLSPTDFTEPPLISATLLIFVNLLCHNLSCTIRLKMLFWKPTRRKICSNAGFAIRCCFYPVKRNYTVASNAFLRVHDEVLEALNSKKPVVALETTIYTHGRYSFITVDIESG
jgi:hypothetical protein